MNAVAAPAGCGLGLRLTSVLLASAVVLSATAFNTGIPAAAATPAASPQFSPQEIQQILTLGPWPALVLADPGNRVSGQPLAIELGRRLFRDPRMSPVGYISCLTCHQPDRSFTDLKARAHGLADLPRNTPALLNLRQQKWFGWDGSSDSLWLASIRPMLDAREFDSSPATVARLFKRDPELAACYRKVFQSSPQGDPQRTLVNVGKALAAYQETLVTARTPFDEFRDVLAGAPMVPALPKMTVSIYPAAAQRGLKLFVGQGGCIACHQGPNFSDQRFHNVLHARARSPAGPGAPPDAGRLAGAISLKNNPMNLTSAYNDDPQRSNQLATHHMQVRDDLRGQFRTPSLRNVTATPPYMHDGRIDRLQDAVLHGDRAAPPLSAQHVDDLAAFLATLADAYGQRRPWPLAGFVSCP